MTTARHLTPARLVDYARGLLTSPDDRDVEAHLTDCARCSAEVAVNRKVFELARSDDLEDAPLHVLNRAIRLFKHSQRQAAYRRPLERLLAVLRFDSLQAPLALGVRSGSTGPRQLVYVAGGYTVELRIATRGSLSGLTGQVLGPCQRGRVTLAGPLGDTDAGLSDLCEFELGPLPGGTYQMTVHLADVEVDLPQLELP